MHYAYVYVSYERLRFCIVRANRNVRHRAMNIPYFRQDTVRSEIPVRCKNVNVHILRKRKRNATNFCVNNLTPNLNKMAKVQHDPIIITVFTAIPISAYFRFSGAMAYVQFARPVKKTIFLHIFSIEMRNCFFCKCVQISMWQHFRWFTNTLYYNVSILNLHSRI